VAGTTVRADLCTPAYAERDISVFGIEASQTRLKLAVVVDDRPIDAARLNLVRGAPAEEHVSGCGSHAQPIER
jgi:hypothetical protein